MKLFTRIFAAAGNETEYDSKLCTRADGVWVSGVNKDNLGIKAASGMLNKEKYFAKAAACYDALRVEGVKGLLQRRGRVLEDKNRSGT